MIRTTRKNDSSGTMETLLIIQANSEILVFNWFSEDTAELPKVKLEVEYFPLGSKP